MTYHGDRFSFLLSFPPPKCSSAVRLVCVYTVVNDEEDTKRVVLHALRLLGPYVPGLVLLVFFPVRVFLRVRLVRERGEGLFKVS